MLSTHSSKKITRNITKTLLLSASLFMSLSSSAATKCYITASDLTTGDLKNQILKYEYSMNMSSAGGEILYEFKEPSRKESIRIQYGIMLADKTVQFLASKFHKKDGVGTVSENKFCDVDLENGQGEEDCKVDNINVNLRCEQVDEGNTYTELIALMEEFENEQSEVNIAKRCAMSLKINLNEKAAKKQSELEDLLKAKLEEKGAIFVDKKTVRAIDTNIDVEKKFLRCKVKVAMKATSDENIVQEYRAKAFSCDKAIRKLMDKIEACR